MKENTDNYISIIVPVYNSEKYLKECIQSILNQTYSNLEVILVNDGSTDNSLKICYEFSEADERVKVVDQKNAGPSAARNRGLNEATGNYIGFVDSDDTIEPDMYEILINNLKEYNAELSLVSMQYCYEDGNKRPYYSKEEKHVINKAGILNIFVENLAITFGPVDKLYLREVIGDTRFDTSIKMCEDQKFVYEILKKVSKVIYDPRICYNVRCSEGSLSRAKATRYHLAMLDVNEYILKELQDEDTKAKLRLYNTNLCLSYFVVHYENGNFNDNDVKRVNNIINENKSLIMRRGDKKMIIKLILFLFSPRLLRMVILNK